jgi:hypothetical protein
MTKVDEKKETALRNARKKFKDLGDNLSVTI